MAADEAPAEGAAPRLGTYVGRQRDYSCPGDHATWEVTFLEGSFSTIACRSELSLSKGGLQAWLVEGTWEWDEDDEEVLVTVTKDDPLGGPKREREVKLPLGEDGSLTFRAPMGDVPCAWERPPPDLIAEKLDAMPLKELKATAIASGLDPDGCIERGDFMRILNRARANGKLVMPSAEPTPSPPPSSQPSEPPKAASAASPAAEGPSPTPSPAPAPAPVPAAAAPKAAPAPAAAPAAEEASPAAEEAAVEEAGCYSLEQLTDKRVWEKLDIKASERETYLPEAIFSGLFGVSKAEFAKMPKWKKDNFKKKHGLF